MENQAIADRLVAHLVRSRAYGLTLRQAIEAASRDHRSALVRLIRGDRTDLLRVEVDNYVRALMTTASTGVGDFLGSELDFHYNNINRSAGSFYEVRKPNRDIVARRFLSTPLRLGTSDAVTAPMGGLFNRLGTSELSRINREVREGIVQGLSRPELESRVLRAARLSENQAQTIVTTSLTQASEMASEAFWEENDDLLAGFTFSAILDAATSRICSTNNGTFFPKDNVELRPPLHWGCRSTLIPVLAN
jgi:SPP1 gp7 family putative phage head morphogenesis protein